MLRFNNAVKIIYLVALFNSIGCVDPKTTKNGDEQDVDPVICCARPFSLYATIVDENENPIPHAEAKLINMSLNIELPFVNINETGNYGVNIFQPETYDIYVSAVGFQQKIIPDVRFTFTQCGLRALDQKIQLIKESSL